jgi:gamma-glutamyltranspeptidase / glutathione hydrolase
MPEALVPVPLARGARGAVVAPHHLATAAGLEVLSAGGNAVDAAIATNAVLAVVKPNACGIGGDAFWLIWDQASGTQYALNGSGRSPAAANAAALRAGGLRTLPYRGPLTITVPGAVRSWGDAHRRFGRLGRDRILESAIAHAADGFPAWDGLIDSIEAMVGIVDTDLGSGSAFGRVFRPAGRPRRPGERIRLPALAMTLRRLADEGFDAFYEGELADRQVASLVAAGAPFAVADYRDHRSTWTDPIATTYRGVTVTTHPPNSSGIVALELLNILERFGSPAAAGDVDWVHLGIEAAKLAMADRDAFVCDPERRDVPVARLLDKGYAAELATRIDPRRAAIPPAATTPLGGGTIYLATVDGDGSAVSLIESVYGGFGSGVVCPDTGVHFHNRGSYFSLDPGHPNSLEPRRRTLHTLLPGMLFRDGPEPWVVLGSMGGDAQPQVHAQLVSALVDGGVDVRTATSAARWFVEPANHFDPPVEVRLEPRFAPAVVEGLRARGHPVTEVAAFDSLLGHAHAIELVDGGPAAGGSLAAATDPRSPGLPAVR